MFAIPVIALVSSMVVFGERLAVNEWTGIALIGAGSRSSPPSRGGSRDATRAPVTAPAPLDGG